MSRLRPLVGGAALIVGPWRLRSRFSAPQRLHLTLAGELIPAFG